MSPSAARKARDWKPTPPPSSRNSPDPTGPELSKGSRRMEDPQNLQATGSARDYSDLKAVFFNGTLKRSPQTSNMDGLIDISRLIMEKQGVSTRVIRTVDLDIASGVYPDMTEYGWPTDE